jgi:RHS repeat-associated protein
MPEAARLTDPVEHGLGMLGMIGGMILGAAVGAIAIAATVATGGAALAIAVAVVGAVGATAGGGLAGEQLANGIATIMGCSGITSGAIIPATSVNVMIGHLPAARAKLDGAACGGMIFNHFPNPKALIATGSSTVLINGMPAARKQDKLVCNADIQKGEPTVIIGGATVQVLPIEDNEAWLHNLLGKVALGALAGVALLLGGGFLAGAICGTALLEFIGVGVAFFAGNEMLGALGDKLGPGWRDTLQGGFGIAALVGGGAKGLRDLEAGRPFFGEPVDGITGEVCIRKTDFTLPGALELTLKRSYASDLDYGSSFGPRWCSTWGQRVEHSGASAIYYTDDGRSIGFGLFNSPDAEGWVRNTLVNKIRLRRTGQGFQVRDAQRRLLRFEQQDNNQWLLTAIEDANANSIRFEYSGDGALQSVTHSGGYQLVVDATPAQIRRIALITFSGKEVELMRYEYDARGFLTAVIDGSGQPFRYTYDDNARVTRWDDRLGTYYDYTYDAQGRCVEAVGPGGMYHYRFQYDEITRTNHISNSYGALTSLTYNQRLQLTSLHTCDGVTVTEWDECSNKLRETKPDGSSVSYAYDEDGNLLATQDPLGRTTKLEYNEALLPTALTDAEGKRWLRQYDVRGNLLAAELEGAPEWRYEYDAAGNLITSIDPENKIRRYTHNAAGLPLSVTDAEGHVTRYGRDSFGRVKTQVDPLGHETRFSYNTLMKLARVALPDGAKISWGYDVEGNITERVGADGTVYRYQYGAFDKLRSIQRPSGATLHFNYDLEARLHQVTNERGELWQYDYDDGGRVFREKEFSGRTLHFTYDSSGFLTARINGNGETVINTRNKVGQIVAKTLSDGTAAEFQYGVDGLITLAKNDSITVKFERDAYGRVVREIQGDHVVESSFDARGLRTTRRINGQETAWRYDGNGRVQRLGLPGDEWLEFTRDAMGRDTERRLTRQGTASAKAGGFVLRQEFDPMSHLTHQWAGAGTVAASERQWQYDLNGNPISQMESLWGASQFTYNSDGRIENVDRQRGVSENFRYDAAGDIAAVWTGGLRENSVPGERPAMGTVQMRFVGQGGRLEKVGETRFSYDADGRTTEKREGNKVWQYEWTIEGQLRAVTTPTNERWTYEYDAFGRRVKKTGPTGSTTYIWDGSVVAEEISPTRTAAWHFEPGTFRPIAKVENGAAYACVTDQVGTPRELITRTGRLAWSVKLSAFGEVESVKATDTECPIRFQGQWFDEESGLHYNWNRYYEPETGRYLSADPIGFNGGTRSYGYTHNPLSWVDPGGLASYPGVDFTGSPDLFPTTGNQQNIVAITMQGSRQRDFTQAYQQSGISKADATDYTWHHVDDFNPQTGETTMQLVKTSAHVESFPHTGSVSQFDNHFGVEYDTPEAIKASYDQGWLKGRVPKELQTGVCK